MRKVTTRLVYIFWALTLTIAGLPAFADGGIGISPPALNFGSEYVGLTTTSLVVTVSNTTGHQVTISSFALAGEGFQLTQGLAPYEFASGENSFYTIAFAPQSGGTIHGTFTVNFAGGDPPLSIPLSGTGVVTTAVASVTPTILNFGNVTEGSIARTQTFTVSNTGTEQMKITAITLDPPFSMLPFIPTILQPGNSAQFKVGFLPSAVSPFVDTVVVHYDSLPAQGVNLIGVGTGATSLAIPTFATLPQATQGAEYSAPLTAAGGKAPYRWRAQGSLPAGLRINSAGLLFGTLSPTVKTGNQTLSVQVQDSNQTTVTKTFTLPVLMQTGATCNNIVWDVSGTNTPITPLDVLGTGTYLGSEGGLYPSGSNTVPPRHEADGVNLADAILPLDSNGNVDIVNGRKVLVLMGESAVHLEATQILGDFMAIPSRDPKLIVVNAGQGDGTASEFSDANAPYWTTITNYILPNSGVDAEQVVAVWYEPTDAITSGTFPGDIADLQSQIEQVIVNVHTFFPNAKLMYFSSRIYGGYSNGESHVINPEPYAYEDGFAVKWAIQDQLDGDPRLNYNPGLGPVNAPWVAWGPYYWGNGMTPRPEGLVWTCQDVLPDGTHPTTPTGVQKVADEMLNFFLTSETVTPWFLSQTNR